MAYLPLVTTITGDSPPAGKQPDLDTAIDLNCPTFSFIPPECVFCQNLNFIIFSLESVAQIRLGIIPIILGDEL